MINSIQRIKGLGVFNSFSAQSDLASFGIKNLLDGWNYSGKTTLSRLFELLEAKKPNLDLPEISFAINTSLGPFNEGNFQNSNLTVRVFNSDFVAETYPIAIEKNALWQTPCGPI